MQRTERGIHYIRPASSIWRENIATPQRRTRKNASMYALSFSLQVGDGDDNKT